MKVLELFAGTQTLSSHFRARGHDCVTVDFDKETNPDICTDIEFLTYDELSSWGPFDVVWMSPDCTTYSVAAISYHRKKDKDGNLVPQTEYAKKCDRVNAHAVELIEQLDPSLWFIENPRGGLRKMDFMQGLPRYTISYCQYGERRQKPTDIWTNHPDPKFKPCCKPGSPCHDPAPRGSRTGTQGLTGKLVRAKLPDALCEHIVDICEEVI